MFDPPRLPGSAGSTGSTGSSEPACASAEPGTEPRGRGGESEAVDALGRVHGTPGLHAAVLALLLPPDNERATQAWQRETLDIPQAQTLRGHALALSGATRLPCFELLVTRMHDQPIAARRALLMATRRVMSARGPIHPLDRLHWLEMRQRLGEPSHAQQQGPAHTELAEMPQGDVQAVSIYSAYLSRVVPGEAAGPDAGPTWYAAVMEPWRQHGEVLKCTPPDADTMVSALLAIQSLAWMQRPMLLHRWVEAALQLRAPQLQPPHPFAPGSSGFHDDAADALRITGTLLNSPLPPELMRHYSTTPEDIRR